MKRIIASLLFVIQFLSITACAKKDNSNTNKAITTTESTTIVTTTETTTKVLITKSKYLIDNANLFEEKEKDLIIRALDDVRNQSQFDVAILTTKSFNGKIVDDYAADYYNSKGYGYGDNKDGCLLVINMTDREWYLYTHGFGTDAINDDYGVNYISDQFLPDLKENKYTDAMLEFVEYVQKFVEQANYGEPFSDSNPYREAIIENDSTTEKTTTEKDTTTYMDRYAGIYTDLEENCWYQYKQYPYLKIYNTVVKACNINSYNKSCRVAHYPVCCMCHISSNFSMFTVVDFDNTVEETYYCSKCGATTYVELKLNKLL